MAKSKETLYTEADLVENPNIRIPVCLCIDASKSMSYDGGIKKLQLGIKKLYEEIALILSAIPLSNMGL
jgi:uncharacterized protein YegL